MKDNIREVYAMLKNREINPAGTFDSVGRFYAEHDDLICVRSPSRAWPFSEMMACRTLKYVKAIAEQFECSTKKELIDNV